MNHPPSQGEVRPAATPECLDPDPFVPDPSSPVPLLRLRREREPIRPEDCLVEGCPVCAWRAAGLIPPVGD